MVTFNYQSVLGHLIVAEIFKDLLEHAGGQVEQVHFHGDTMIRWVTIHDLVTVF